ncbi:BA75_01954T0 [Komagataella pastoris]|uniref:BA75_01954T0 n=1 Tax=Komagataella pastoris TaxID=4922 RepID=A0A1B2JAU0_PICPA|nr:BA75_01954T0 [Komagataella pastoris]
MTKEIHTEVLVNASPKKVWSVLTDFEAYPSWNPFIKSLTGDVAVGNTINVRIQPPNGGGMSFSPKVLQFEENKKFQWKGKLLFEGLFDGEHVFELIDNGDNTTLFRQSESFSGIFVYLFNTKNTTSGFEEMNRELKELAEKS